MLNRIRKIGNALDKAGNIIQADFVDKNMITLAHLMRYKMTKMKKEGSFAEEEIQKLFLVLLPKTDFAGKVFSVGGYERDKLLGTPSKDLDIVIEEDGGAKRLAEFLHNEFPEQTTAPWQQGGSPDDKKEKKTYPIWGISFKEDVEYDGVKYKTSGGDLDIADTQSEYFPDSESRQRETKYDTLEADNERRDFTVNMLLRDLTSGELKDLTGTSKQDIEKGILRHKSIDMLRRSFEEDPLRIMRLIRFQCKYDWEIPLSVLRVAKEMAPRMEIISWERITGELEKVAKVGKLKRAVRLMRAIGLLEYILPEIYAMIGVNHDKRTHEEGDVYKHTLQVLSHAPPTIIGQFSALLHDVGKPTTQEFVKDKITFYGHDKVGGEIAEAVLRRLKFEKDDIKLVRRLVEEHMNVPNLFGNDEANIKSYRKFIRRVGDTMMDSLIDLARADSLGTLPPKDYIPEFRKKLEDAMEVPIEDKSILDGNEIKQLLNIKPGPIIGKVMKFLNDLSDKKAEEGVVLDKEEAKQAILEEFGKIQEVDDSSMSNIKDPEFSDFISKLEKGELQFVNTYSDNPRKDNHYPTGGRGPMMLNEVPGPQ
jgi:poly(A) polymerase